MTPLPPPDKPSTEKLVQKISFLDHLVAMGEESYEIEFEVNECAHMASVLFFGWLMHKNLGDGAEVLASMVKHFINNIYLDDERSRRRYCTLNKVTKKQLADFINLVDFAVAEDLWNQHLNPFDGLRLFYQFLDQIGYDANLSRRENALRELRRSLKKKSCAIPQQGCDLMQ